VITESVVLCAAGGLGGILLAFWISGAIVSALGTAAPYWIEFGIDVRVLSFGLVLTFATGVVCGLPPAFQSTTSDLQTELKQGGSVAGHRSARRVRTLLAGAQLALSLVLLAGAGLLIKTVARTYEFDIGYDPDRVLIGDVELSGPRYDEPGQILAFSRSVIERLERIPGVRAAASRTVFFAGFGATPRRISVEGVNDVPQGSAPGFYHAVTPGYFAALGVPLRQGRDFSDEDSTGVVIVNEEMARRIWSGQTAVGRRIRLGDATSGAPWLTVVGVVANAGGSPFSRGGPAVYAYVPLAAEPGRSLAIAIGAANPSPLVAELIPAVNAADPDQPVEDVMTMAQMLERWMSPARFMGLLMSSLAAVALSLASMGTFSVVAFGVSRRVKEIGIRLAIGATPAQVQWLMTRSGLSVLVGGLAIGLPAAALSTRVLEGVLAGTSPTDPLVFAAVAATLTLVALAASWLPARRAARVDPLIVLRSE
jgi:putative ABC transport system permease protein